MVSTPRRTKSLHATKAAFAERFPQSCLERCPTTWGEFDGSRVVGRVPEVFWFRWRDSEHVANKLPNTAFATPGNSRARRIRPDPSWSSPSVWRDLGFRTAADLPEIGPQAPPSERLRWHEGQMGAAPSILRAAPDRPHEGDPMEPPT